MTCDGADNGTADSHVFQGGPQKDECEIMEEAAAGGICFLCADIRAYSGAFRAEGSAWQRGILSQRSRVQCGIHRLCGNAYPQGICCQEKAGGNGGSKCFMRLCSCDTSCCFRIFFARTGRFS